MDIDVLEGNSSYDFSAAEDCKNHKDRIIFCEEFLKKYSKTRPLEEIPNENVWKDENYNQMIKIRNTIFALKNYNVSMEISNYDKEPVGDGFNMHIFKSLANELSKKITYDFKEKIQSRPSYEKASEIFHLKVPVLIEED